MSSCREQICFTGASRTACYKLLGYSMYVKNRTPCSAVGGRSRRCPGALACKRAGAALGWALSVLLDGHHQSLCQPSLEGDE